MLAACKGSHGQTIDAGGMPDAGVPDGASDAPPDAGPVCHVGLSPVPWIAADHTPTDAAIGDVNRDGIADVLVGTQDDATIHVWLGIGGGRFRPGATYAMHDGARGAIELFVHASRGAVDLVGDAQLDHHVAAVRDEGARFECLEAHVLGHGPEETR